MKGQSRVGGRACRRVGLWKGLSQKAAVGDLLGDEEKMRRLR